VGEGEAGEVVGDRCQSVTGLDHHGFRVQTVSTKHCSRPKGRNDNRITSFSHRTKGEYKNLPPPALPKEPTVIYRSMFLEISKTFGNQGSKCQNRGFGFSHDKGVNTRTNNLRVHTAGSNTPTTSVETTTRSGWLEWRNHECPKVTGTTSY